MRYAPTGTLAVAYRLSARRRLRASGDQVLAAFTYEHVSVLVAAAEACLVLFLLAGDMPPFLPLAIALATLVLAAALQPRIAGDLLAVALVHGVYVIHVASTPMRITPEVESAGVRTGWMIAGMWRTALHRHN